VRLPQLLSASSRITKGVVSSSVRLSPPIFASWSRTTVVQRTTNQYAIAIFSPCTWIAQGAHPRPCRVAGAYDAARIEIRGGQLESGERRLGSGGRRHQCGWWEGVVAAAHRSVARERWSAAYIGRSGIDFHQGGTARGRCSLGGLGNLLSLSRGGVKWHSWWKRGPSRRAFERAARTQCRGRGLAASMKSGL